MTEEYPHESLQRIIRELDEKPCSFKFVELCFIMFINFMIIMILVAWWINNIMNYYRVTTFTGINIMLFMFNVAQFLTVVLFVYAFYALMQQIQFHVKEIEVSS
jgi:hypothetical protein